MPQFRKVTYPLDSFALYVRRQNLLASTEFTEKENAFIEAYVLRYLSPDRPTVASLYSALCVALHSANKWYAQCDKPPLCFPSLAEFNRRVATLPQRDVQCARFEFRR